MDAPQHSRTSAVRYTDRALGDFIEEAKTRPWFRNTLFVVVADHCHSTSGRAELPLDKYHIPCLFYNPELVSPRVMDGVCSQIDVAPTLFGLLGWNYVSEFYGRDLLSDVQRPGRAYLGTFQTLAVLDGESGCLTSMSPKKAPQGILWTLTQPFEVQDQKADPQSDRAIAIYQSASMRFAQRLDLLFKKP